MAEADKADAAPMNASDLPPRFPPNARILVKGSDLNKILAGMQRRTPLVASGGGLLKTTTPRGVIISVNEA